MQDVLIITANIVLVSSGLGFEGLLRSLKSMLRYDNSVASPYSYRGWAWHGFSRHCSGRFVRLAIADGFLFDGNTSSIFPTSM